MFPQQGASSSASMDSRSHPKVPAALTIDLTPCTRLQESGEENVGVEVTDGAGELQIELGGSNARAPKARDPSTGHRDGTGEDRLPLPMTAPSVESIRRDSHRLSSSSKLDRRWNTMQLVELGTKRLDNWRPLMPKHSQHCTVVEEEPHEVGNLPCLHVRMQPRVRFLDI